MRRVLLSILAVAATLPAAAEDPPLVYGASGAPVAWGDMVARRGPLAILAWASWAPSAEQVLGQRRELALASRERGLQLVLLNVQEPLEDARRALRGSDLEWIHDRHGALLKTYRIITVPSIVVVSRQGAVLGRLGASPEALRGWRPE